MREHWNRRSWIAAAVAGLVSGGAPALAKPPAGYPRSYRVLEAQARRERQLLVYSAADLREVDGLLRAFKSRYPEINVVYRHLASKEVYDRYLREVSKRRPSADLVFNSAMDLQIKLVNDGYAQSYRSPEEPYLPSWAVWKNEAWGVTAEPIVFAYNRRLMPAADVPRSHDELERMLRLKGERYRGRLATYDVERSSTGFLFFTQDEQISRDTWSALRALGRLSPKLYVAGEDMLQRLSAGELAFAYNLMSSYVLEQQALDRNIGVVFPSDYTLVMSRIAFISREAVHPAAAKLFLDFMLSRDGQRLLAQRYMTPVRSDLTLVSPPIPANARRAIHVGPALLANLDRLKQARLLAEWKRAVSDAR